MGLDRDVPREVKVVNAVSLLRLETLALDTGLSQRLPPGWVAKNAAPEGWHYLRAAFWHELAHPPGVPRHLRCELLLHLHTGEHALSLLDVQPDDFASLEEVTSRDERMRVKHLLDGACSVREWDLRQESNASED